MYCSGAEEDRETFKDTKRGTRREIARERNEREEWEEWSRNLNTTEGRGKMFRIAKQMNKDKSSVYGTNCIQSNTGEIKVEGAEVCGRRKE